MNFVEPGRSFTWTSLQSLIFALIHESKGLAIFSRGFLPEKDSASKRQALKEEH
jgi:hypothetical protein